MLDSCGSSYPIRFDSALAEYEDFYSLLTCYHFGAPVHRTRAYDAVVSKRHTLKGGLSNLYQLSSKCVLDAAIWLQANKEEAMVLC